MKARPNDFTDLYGRYRVNASLRASRGKEWRDTERRGILLGSAVVLFAAAAVAEILAGAKVAVVVGSALAALLAVAAFGLLAGFVVSASDASERDSANHESERALERISDTRPNSEAGDREVAEWVRRVEGALGQADPGPDRPVAS
jgi:ABC-type transport system involved in cytochrome bd biosynthesis fused ATPase/permease subunit